MIEPLWEAGHEGKPLSADDCSKIAHAIAKTLIEIKGSLWGIPAPNHSMMLNANDDRLDDCKTGLEQYVRAVAAQGTK